jgi:hypothetical protein
MILATKAGRHKETQRSYLSQCYFVALCLRDKKLNPFANRPKACAEHGSGLHYADEFVTNFRPGTLRILRAEYEYGSSWQRPSDDKLLLREYLREVDPIPEEARVSRPLYDFHRGIRHTPGHGARFVC